MPQFGTGPQLAAQCQPVPTPDGWRPWSDADGPVPDKLGSRAAALVNDASVPLGTTESFPLPGVTTLIRVEPRVWSRDATGTLVEGCFRSSGIYLPIGSATGAGIVPPDSSLNRTVGVLTAASLVIGIAASLHKWGS